MICGFLITGVMHRTELIAPSFRLRHFLFFLAAAAGLPAVTMSQSAMVSEHRLVNDLLVSYAPNVRPYTNISEPLHTSFGVSLMRIVELNQETGILDTCLKMKTAWHDVRLMWNPADYNDVTEVRLPADHLWTPDIVPLDSIDNVPLSSSSPPMMVVASGHVVWVFPTRLRTSCQTDVSHFPFDEQTCVMHFGSWTYDGRHINLTWWGETEKTAFTVDTDMESMEWTLHKYGASIRYVKHDCCPQPLPELKVTLILKRNPAYYVHVFIVPAVLLGLLVPFHLLLPPGCSERITLGSILLASFLLLILKLQDAVPNVHSQLPAIGLFYTLNMVWASLAMISSILSLNLHSRGPRRGKVPDSIRSIFLSTLKQLVCLDSNTYYLINNTDSVSMRGLEHSKVTLTSPATDYTDRHFDQPGAAHTDTRPAVSSKLEQGVEEINRQLHVLGSHALKHDAREDVVNEWRLVSLVLDRLLFVAFFVIYLLCAIIVLA